MIRILKQLQSKGIQSSNIQISNSNNFISESRTSNTLFQFSKAKKIMKAQIKVPTINISKINQAHDGFLLYQNQESNRFKGISLAFLFCFVSGYWTYTKLDDDEIKVNYMIIGVLMAIPFLIFQFRTVKTLKRMVLDKTGQNIIMTRFRFGGFGEESTKAKIQILKGIDKAFVFGGSVIKGGGMYGYEERNYWFQAKYIIEREAFEETVQGHRLKIDKIKQYD